MSVYEVLTTKRSEIAETKTRLAPKQKQMPNAIELRVVVDQITDSFLFFLCEIFSVHFFTSRHQMIQVKRSNDFGVEAPVQKDLEILDLCADYI